MRILIVNPNTTEEMTDSISVCGKRYARPDTEIVAVNPDKGPASLEGFFDDAIAAEAVLELLIQHKKDFDAYIIACFGDPGLFAAREVLDAPVLGIAESAMLTACTLGYRFTVMDVLKRTWPQMEDLIGRYGMKERCASIRAVEIPVLDLESNPGRVRDLLVQESRKALEEDKAEVILLGCAGMSGLDETGMDKSMEKILGVPALDGVVCAVKMAEALIDYEVTTSKIRAFKYPESKKFKNCSPAIASIGKFESGSPSSDR